MSHPLRALGDGLFETAPLVVPATVELDAPPEAVWAALASDEMWSWTPVLDRLRWLSARPLGEGAVRTIRVARLFTLEEHFYRWEEPRRATFHAVRSTRPVVDALAEDFVLEPTATGTRLRWTLALDPRVPGAARLAPALAPLLVPGNRRLIGGIAGILPRA